MKIKSFNEHKKESTINEYWGGPITDLLNPRIDSMIQYLQEYKEELNTKNTLSEGAIRKIEDMWNIMQGVPPEAMAADHRYAQKIKGNGESLPQRIKRTIKNF